MALGQALANLTVAGILCGFVVLVASLYQLYKLVRALDLGPEGTKFTLTQMTIKIWAAAILAYFGAGALLRGVGGVPMGIRQWLNVGLAWALVAQATWATLVYRRWRLGPRRRSKPIPVAPVERVTVQEAVDIVEEQRIEAVRQLEEAARREGGIPDD